MGFYIVNNNSLSFIKRKWERKILFKMDDIILSRIVISYM
jgi:hypothetical protein